MIMTCSELSSLILQNRDSIAFLVGNGIHNYEFWTKGGIDKVSWDDLLKKIRSGHGVNSLKDKPKEGITNPEYFDLIELLYIQQQLVKEHDGFQNSVTSYVKHAEKLKCQDFNSLPLLCGTRTEEDKIYSSTSSCYENESLIKAKSEIKERVFSIYDDFGLPHEEISATYDQQAVAMELLHGGARKFYLIKRDIKEQFNDYSLQDWILPFLIFANKEQTPILTTNYDEALSKKLHLSRHCKNGNSKSQYTFPFETYFSTKEIEEPWKEFAIWHINGLVSYPQSIRIGYLDYAKMFNAIRERIYIPMDSTEFFSLIRDDENLRNTWISIFFHRNLFIWGVALDEDEYVLRWLLVERARYNLLAHKQLKGWYVHLIDVDNPMTDGKKMFLNTVGFEIIEVNSHDLHENVWQQIMNEYEV